MGANGQSAGTQGGKAGEGTQQVALAGWTTPLVVGGEAGGNHRQLHLALAATMAGARSASGRSRRAWSQ